MSKIEVTKVCEFCGKKFTAHKMTTRFCSHQCSQRNYKTEKREQKLEKVFEGENLQSPSPTTLKKEYLSCDDVAKLMGISGASHRLATGHIPERLRPIPQSVDGIVVSILSLLVLPSRCKVVCASAWLSLDRIFVSLSGA